MVWHGRRGLRTLGGTLTSTGTMLSRGSCSLSRCVGVRACRHCLQRSESFPHPRPSLPQIETVAGVDACEAVARVEGVDVLYVGPTDLSVSIGGGKPLPFDDPRLVAARVRVAAACRAAGKAAGILCLTPEHVPVVRAGEGMGGGGARGVADASAPRPLSALVSARRGLHVCHARVGCGGRGGGHPRVRCGAPCLGGRWQPGPPAVIASDGRGQGECIGPVSRDDRVDSQESQQLVTLLTTCCF